MIDSSVNEVKDRLNIVDIISGYIKLNKAGRNFKALCPFHNEKSPSFMVNPERQIWHCFGCGEGGDVFTFVMKMDGLEFPEALKFLAEKAGVELKRSDFKASGQKNKVLEILEEATDFYIKTLHETDDGRSAFKYLRDRGMSESSIKEWRIGFSPDDWRKTLEYLLNRGYKLADIFAAGLTIEKTNSGPGSSNIASHQKYYDRFRGRVMFSISDLSARVIGFGARIFSAEINSGKKSTERNDAAKYINTPQTISYNKSKVLYGFDKAKSWIAKANFCILVEGYTDVIASYQAGIKNVVSSSGTSLTIEQLRLIKRYTNNLVIAYDMDLAGEGATRRGIELALEEGFNIKVPRLPNEQDPADCIKDDPGIWTRAIKDKRPILDYYFDDAFNRFDGNSISGKKNIIDFLLPVLSKISSFVERDVYIKRLSEKLGVDESKLFDEIKKIRPAGRDNFSMKENRGYTIKEETLRDNTLNLEEILIGLAIAFMGETRDVFLKIDTDVFLNPKMKDAAGKLSIFLKDKFQTDYKDEKEAGLRQKDFLRIFEDEERRKLSLLAFASEELCKGADAGAEFGKIYANLMCHRLAAKLNKLSVDIKNAETSGDKEAENLLRKEHLDISIKKNFFNERIASIK